GVITTRRAGVRRTGRAGASSASGGSGPSSNGGSRPIAQRCARSTTCCATARPSAQGRASRPAGECHLRCLERADDVGGAIGPARERMRRTATTSASCRNFGVLLPGLEEPFELELAVLDPPVEQPVALEQLVVVGAARDVRGGRARGARQEPDLLEPGL